MYTKEFKELVNECKKSNQYVGLGNPNAKILFIGKEPAMEVGTENTHGSAESWEDNKVNYSSRFTDEKLNNHGCTWQKYQKLYNQIIENLNLDKKYLPQKEYEITFVENIFTTELSNLPAPTTKQAKEIECFNEKLDKRKNIYFKSSFIKQFPITVITASDNKYIETYSGEVCKIFEVDYDEKIEVGNTNKMWIHYSKNRENPRLLIHTRQLTNGASDALIERIAKIISDFITNNDIDIINKK